MSCGSTESVRNSPVGGAAEPPTGFRTLNSHVARVARHVSSEVGTRDG